jgi:hypothetical protein
MAAKMWRQHASVVKKSGGAFIETNGYMSPAPPATDGYYWLSDVGAGVYPLVLLGAWHEIGPFLTASRKGVRNVRVHQGEYGPEAMDDIYVKVGVYTPAKMKGLFPFHDVAAALATGIGGMAAAGVAGVHGPGSMIADVGSAISDLVGAKEKFSGVQMYSEQKVKDAPKGTLYVQFMGYKTAGAKRLGHRKIHFRSHAAEIIDLMAEHVTV